MKIIEYAANYRKKQAWRKVISVLAAVVVFCTTYALIIPAITMESMLICEKEEHTHSEACYEDGILVCELEEHVHADECYDAPSQAMLEQQEAAENIEAVEPVKALVPTENTYYKMVKTIDSTTANYLIVANDGYYSLCLSGTPKQIKLNPVDGNTGYFTVENPGNITLWNFDKKVTTGSNTGVSIKESTSGTAYGKKTYTVSYEANKCENPQANKVWRFAESAGKYINIKFDTSISFNTTSQTPDQTVANTTWFSIFKEEHTTLNIPDHDYSGGESGGGDDPSEPKPDYEDYIETSDAQSGKAYSTSIRADSEITYASDKSTSQIESRFAGIATDDGKIITDKSVIYGADDYKAFESYGEDEFSITQSVLGQQYPVTTEVLETTPIDVVLVLDCSGSMNYKPTVSGKTASEAKIQTLVKATNKLIETLMAANENNRVGLVTYSYYGDTLSLPISRYYLGKNTQSTFTYDPSQPKDYFICNVTGSTKNPLDSATLKCNVANDTAMRDVTTKAKVTDINRAIGGGTFTQHGIAMGQTLFNAKRNDTTYTTSDGNEHKRTPVYILVSDGDPTIGTSNYRNALDGPAYGSGMASEADDFKVYNNKGVLGYYTILSANHYKGEASEIYQKQARFYSIGMGINTTGVADASGQSRTGDHYKRAVLNPSSNNISGLSNTGASNKEDTAYLLRDLLANSIKDPYIRIGQINSTYRKNVDPNTYLPVLTNPYGDYAYADAGFFNALFTDSDLNAAFDDIVKSASSVYRYINGISDSFSVVLTDYIGAGMEIKDTPVLRYNGVPYTDPKITKKDGVTTYTYSAEVKPSEFSEKQNLENITVAVSGTPGTNQKIVTTIPSALITEYTKARTNDWYYESLPVRVIFKVGLTAASKEAVNALELGESKSFITNMNGTSNKTNATFKPTTGDNANPYYGEGYSVATINKDKNTSETATTSYTESLNKGTLTSTLGNNGRITFTAKDIKMSLTVEKEWDSAVPDKDKKEITVNIYKVSSEGKGEKIDKSLKLNSRNSWKATIELPALAESWKYAVVENVPDNCTAVYDDNQDTFFVNEKEITGSLVPGAADSEVTVKIQNVPYVEMPSTGGIGTTVFYLIGILLIAGSIINNFISRKEKKNEDY